MNAVFPESPSPQFRDYSQDGCCVVNGPGEAREADLGIAAGKGKGVIFKRGEIVRHVLWHWIPPEKLWRV